MDLKDGIVIITGGSGLLGQQYCKAIEEINGLPVCLDIKKPEKGIWCECDITEEDQIIEALGELKQVWKHPVVGLINNAAIDPKFEKDSQNSPKSRLEHYSRADWDKEIAVGLTGAFLCTKVFGTEMAKNGKGSIVNISSVLGLIAPNQALYRDESKSEEMQNFKPITYSVIKHGIIGITRYTATYWAKNNVRCNAIAPGGVYNNHSDEFVSKLSKYIPLGRMADKNEYNESIKFLISDASSFMTGSILSIDGGQTCW